MSMPPLDVSSLQIIGYADVLPPNALPSIVPPVFRRKGQPDSILVPPYSFSSGRYLCDATEISAAELESLEHRREVTLLPAPMDAQREYELWLDQQGLPQYQPRREARRNLNSIAEKEIQEAARAFRDAQWDEAERHSSTAILANERNLDAMAIKIAIAMVKADPEGQDLLRELVEPHSLRAVNARADELFAQYLKEPQRTPQVHCMAGIAAIRSEYA